MKKKKTGLRILLAAALIGTVVFVLWRAVSADTDPDAQMPVTGAKGSLTLADLAGASYDDSKKCQTGNNACRTCNREIGTFGM